MFQIEAIFFSEARVQKGEGDAISGFETHKFKGKEEHPIILIWDFCYFNKKYFLEFNIFNTCQRLKKIENWITKMSGIVATQKHEPHT